MSKFVANSTGQFNSRTCMNINCRREQHEHVDGACPLPAAPAQPETKAKAAGECEG